MNFEENKEEMNADIKQATYQLQEHVENTAKNIYEKLHNATTHKFKQKQTLLRHLLGIVHENGINYRYLGIFRQHINSPEISPESSQAHISKRKTEVLTEVKKLILTEMVARMCKRIIQSLLRHFPCDNYREWKAQKLLVDLLNFLLGTQSFPFWKDNIAVQLAKIDLQDDADECPDDIEREKVSQMKALWNKHGTIESFIQNNVVSSKFISCMKSEKKRLKVIKNIPCIKYCIMEWFGYHSLSAVEWHPTFDIRQAILLDRLCTQVGLDLVAHDEICEALGTTIIFKGELKLAYYQLKNIGMKIKHTQLAEESEGICLYHHVCRHELYHVRRTAKLSAGVQRKLLKPLMLEAEKKLEKSLERVPLGFTSLFFLLCVKDWLISGKKSWLRREISSSLELNTDDISNRLHDLMAIATQLELLLDRNECLLEEIGKTRDEVKCQCRLSKQKVMEIKEEVEKLITNFTLP